MRIETVPAPQPLDPPLELQARSERVRSGDTLAGVLGRLGLDGPAAAGAVNAFAELIELRHVRPGESLRVVRAGEAIQRIEYRRGPIEEYVVTADAAGVWSAHERAFELTQETVRVDGVLESSLYEAIREAGESPSLAMALADVLAWDVDFYLDPRKGDSFRIVVEKLSHEGRTIRYGDILAAEYDGQVTGKRRVFRYTNPETGEYDYYAEDGSAAKRTFLKSPLKFARISSGYGGRIHPTLKYYKQHQGVDYAAATGTPVWAIGDGVVTRAGWGGACGNMVVLRHANGLETIYCHFSRIAKDVRVGMRVPQKQVIGYVGATGRATGPHLHFGVKRHGRFVNPLTLKLPPAEPLPAEELPAFQEAIAEWVDELNDTRLASAEKEGEIVGP